LTARLDRLPTWERDTVERASVEGEVFHRGAVAALLNGEVEQLAGRLQVLVERELAFPAEARFVDEAAFRFRHALVRDAAYEGLVKRLRAELHERFAGWLEDKARDRLPEVEEIVDYHLEQAFRYRRELGLEAGALAERAAERLFAAGGRTRDRGDVPAAVNLLQRTVDLTPADPAGRARRLLQLGDMLFSAGEFERMDAAFAEAEALAADTGDRPTELFARLDRKRYAVDFSEPGRRPEELVSVAREAIPVFEQAGDEQGLAAAWMGVGDYHRERREVAAWDEAYERALVHARRSGDRRQLAMALARLAGTFTIGPFRVDEVIARVEPELADPAFPAQPRAVWTAFLGKLEASRGNLERGRELCRVGRALAEEIGNVIAIVITTGCAADVEELAGDVEAAEQLVREDMQRLERMGHRWAAGYRTELARLALLQGRLDEAEELLEDDDSPDLDRDAVRALLLARRGNHTDAERLARAAVETLEATDATPLQAEMHRTLADVLLLTGNQPGAREALARALTIEENRGATLLAERTWSLMAGLDPD
jgi:tetratricopeptide (TPR) repeat protein